MRTHRSPKRIANGSKRRPSGQSCSDRAGDIYLVSLDSAEGHEQRGYRPVTVISPAAFNRLTGVPVVLPITTGGNFARVAGFAVSLEEAGTQTRGIIRCDQPRALDITARNGRRIDRAPTAVIAEVLARVAAILG